jgi:hypothetical protein
VKKRSSKTPQSASTVSGHGDADAAIAVAMHLRAAGFHVSSIRVGEATIEMPVIVDAKVGGVSMPRETKSVLEEWGGKQFAQAFEGTGDPPDIVDDDEQPAVRS